MEVTSYRELKVLEELSADPSLTQRGLSKKLEVALGLTNLMIRRLITKGYLAVSNSRKNRLQYLITPRGLAEKTRLTYEFMEYSLHLYHKVREVLKESLIRIVPNGQARVVFFGTGEIAEIAYLTIKELECQLVGVLDDQVAGTKFLGFPVQPLDQVDSLSFDCGVVSSFTNGVEELRQRLQARGVPAKKLIIIERDRAKIHAMIPGLDR